MKKLIVVGTGLTMAALLAGCQESNIQYKGQIMPVSEAQERIADELEVDNPDMDLEVRISEEADE